MNNKPFFSIIMPNYNNGHNIKESIQSVINQDFGNWELLIIDNNSYDDSKDIFKSFKDTRIKFFNIQNQGVIAKSRNLGIKMSKGKWIAFLDSDDVFEKDKLSVIYSAIENKSDGIFYHNCYKIISNRKTKKNIGVFKPSKNSLSRLLTYGNRIVLSSIVIKKIFLDNKSFSEKKANVTVEDFDLLIKLLERDIPLNYINKTLGGYRISKSSLSQKKNHFENTISFLERKKNILSEKDIRKVNIYISYCKIKGKLIYPLEGYKILLKHNIFSFILIKSYIINTISFFGIIKKNIFS